MDKLQRRTEGSKPSAEGKLVELHDDRKPMEKLKSRTKWHREVNHAEASE